MLNEMTNIYKKGHVSSNSSQSLPRAIILGTILIPTIAIYLKGTTEQQRNEYDESKIGGYDVLVDAHILDPLGSSFNFNLTQT